MIHLEVQQPPFGSAPCTGKGVKGRKRGGRVSRPHLLSFFPAWLRSYLLATGSLAAGTARRVSALLLAGPLLAVAFLSLDLDALGLLGGRRSQDGDLQDTILEAGVDLILVHLLGQLQASSERSVAALPHQVASALLLLLFLDLAGDGKNPILDRD